jgi:hypothetical protein
MPLMIRPSLFNTLAIGMKPAYSVVAGDGPPGIKSDSSGRSHPTGSKFTQTHTLQGDTYERITQEPLFDGNSTSVCDCIFRSARKD